MKKILLSLIGLISLCQIANAATARYTFFYAKYSSSYTAVDVILKNKSTGDTVGEAYGLKYLEAAVLANIPESTLLTLYVTRAGTSLSVYTTDNVVFNSGEKSTAVLFGSGSSTNYSKRTNYSSSSNSTKLKVDYMNLASDLNNIDLYIRGTSKIIADNFDFGDNTFTFDNEISAADIVLSISASSDWKELYAYNLLGASLGGDYINLYSVSDNQGGFDMYMLEYDGTVTKLTTKALGIEKSFITSLSTFPNPVISTLAFETSELVSNISVFDNQGNLVLESKSNSDNTINLEKLSSGVHTIKIETANGSILVNKFVKL